MPTTMTPNTYDAGPKIAQGVSINLDVTDLRGYLELGTVARAEGRPIIRDEPERRGRAA